MKNHQKRTIGAIIILLMLSTSPISVDYSFADIEDYKVDKNENNTRNGQKELLKAILTEKIVDGKLKVQHYALPEDTTDEDMHRMLSFEDHASSWAYVNFKTYKSGIVLFDGKASKVGEDLWEISSNGVLRIGEEQSDLNLDGKINGSNIIMHRSVSNEDLSYRIIFSGKIANTDKENAYVISFMNSGGENPKIDQNVDFLQIGELAIKSEKPIDSNQEFRVPK